VRALGPRRALAAAAVGASVVAGGCGLGWANTSDIRAPNPISSNLQNKVVVTADQYGLPLDWDYVGCQGPTPAGRVTCYADTAETPKGEIEASFTVHRQASGCPGRLTVTQDGAPLAVVTANPCR
jgi:hypothetical protein